MTQEERLAYLKENWKQALIGWTIIGAGIYATFKLGKRSGTKSFT
jgi:hypothetical protein